MVPRFVFISERPPQLGDLPSYCLLGTWERTWDRQVTVLTEGKEDGPYVHVISSPSKTEEARAMKKPSSRCVKSPTKIDACDTGC